MYQWDFAQCACLLAFRKNAILKKCILVCDIQVKQAFFKWFGSLHDLKYFKNVLFYFNIRCQDAFIENDRMSALGAYSKTKTFGWAQIQKFLPKFLPKLIKKIFLFLLFKLGPCFYWAFGPGCLL